MSIFRDPDCLENVSSSLGTIAGICSVVPGANGIAVATGLLSKATGSISAWRGELESSNADAGIVLEKFLRDYRRNWRKWSALSESEVRNPGDIESAIASFEYYFNSNDPRRIPSADLIVKNGRDAKKISEAMLQQAAEIFPDIYRKLDQRGKEDQTTKFSRKFFASVIEGGLRNLLVYPGFSNILLPAMQDLALESSSIIKENRDISKGIQAEVEGIDAKLQQTLINLERIEIQAEERHKQYNPKRYLSKLHHGIHHLGEEFLKAGTETNKDLFTLCAENTVVFAWFKARADWWDRSSNLLLTALDRLGPEYQLAPQSWNFGGFDLISQQGRDFARTELWENLSSSNRGSHAASIVYIGNVLSDAVPSDSRFEDRLEERKWLTTADGQGGFFVADGMPHEQMRENIKKGLIPITLETRLILETMMAERPLLVCDGAEPNNCSIEVMSLLTWLRNTGVEIGKTGNFMADSHWTLPFARNIFDIDNSAVPNPYRRLDHYTTENAADFFGRDVQTNIARNWFRNLSGADQGEQNSVLAITGPSGVGKSSFVNARVAILAQEYGFEPLIFRPTDLVNSTHDVVPPILGFCTLLADHLGLDEVDHPLVGVPNPTRAYAAATEWVSERLPSDAKFFFVIDQFEEIVDNIANNWSEGAWQTVLDLIADISLERGFPLAITLEDSREKIFETTLHDTAYKQLTRVALKDDEEDFALTVITQPFLEAGFTLGEDLVAQLLKEFSEHSNDEFTSGSALPLLTLKLYGLFNFITRSREISLKSADRLFGAGVFIVTLGDIEGFPLSIREEIKNLAEEAWNETDGGTETDLGMFLRPFISVLPPEENQLTEEGRLVLNSVPGRMFFLVANRQAAFLQRRLIVPTPGGYRLTHQSIIRHWPLAAAWFKNERESILQQDLFLQRSITWEDNGRPCIETATSADVAMAARLLSVRTIDWSMTDLSQLTFLELLNRSFSMAVFATTDDPESLVEGSPYLSQYIHLAASYGMTEIVAKMLERNPAAIGFTRNDQRTVLNCASWTSPETVAFLLDEYEADPHIPDNNGFTAIDAAIWGDNIAAFDKLLSKTDPTKSPEERSNPLYSAANRGRMDFIQKLEQRGFRHDTQYKNGYSSLFGASVNGDPDLFEYCLTRCDVAQRSIDGRTAFDYLALTGKTSLMKRLLFYPKGDLCLDAAPDGTTALMLGAQALQPHSVRFLLRAGLDPNGRTQNTKYQGRTPLHYALDWIGRHSGPAPRYIAEATRETLIALLESGKVDVNLTDKVGKSAYDMARHHPRIQDLLTAHSSFNPNSIPSGIDTPLHIAFRNNEIELIRELLDDPEYVKLLGKCGENNFIPATEMAEIGLENELLELVKTGQVSAWPVADSKGMLLHSAWKNDHATLVEVIISKLPKKTTLDHVLQLAILLSDAGAYENMNRLDPKFDLLLSCVERCPDPQAARYSAALVAAKLANIPLLDQMLKEGVDLSHKDQWGRDVISCACDFVYEKHGTSSNRTSDFKTEEKPLPSPEEVDDSLRRKLAFSDIPGIKALIKKSQGDEFPDAWGRMPVDLVPDQLVEKVNQLQSNRSIWRRIINEISQRL